MGVAPFKVVFDNVDGVLGKMYVQCSDAYTRTTVFAFVLDTMTYHSKEKERTWEGQFGYHDCIEKFFNGVSHTLPIGLIPRVKNYLKETFGENAHIGITDAIRQMFSPPFGKITSEVVQKYADSLGMWRKAAYLRDLGKANAAIARGESVEVPDKSKYGLKLFDHQEQIVLEALNRRRISLLACTSSGKSLSMMVIARYLVDRENRKVLVVVPNAALVQQLFRNFAEDYGWEEAGEHCIRLYANSPDKLKKKQKDELKRLKLGEEAMLKDITISTWQSLRTKPESFFKVFTAVMVDEAHTAKGKELRDILAKCTNANNLKIGFSGTLPDAELTAEITSSPRLRAMLGDVLPGQQMDESEVRKADLSKYIDAGFIEGGIGPRKDIVHLWELIAKGILTPVKVKAIFIPYPQSVRPSICSPKCHYDTERDIVVGNSSRKDVIGSMFDNGYVTTEQNTVILYNFKENMYSLLEHLKETHPEFTYHVVEGDVDVDDRDDISVKLEDSVGNVLIATYQCLRQGVNITLLHNLIMAEPVKSPYTVMQSIGRIVRKNPAKTSATVYDLVDDASYYTSPYGGGQGRLKLNYMMKHFYIRAGYYDKEKIPIEEEHLDGKYEAQVTPDDVKQRRDAAIKKAQENMAKRRPQQHFSAIQQFGPRTMFTR